MIREISKKEFEEKISRKEGDFSNLVFNFEFDFSEFLEKPTDGSRYFVDFEINFSNSIFKKNISFAKINFLNNFIFSKAETEGLVDFFNTTFIRNFQARYTSFFNRVSFNLARFHSDADFSKSIFLESAHFKKTRFYKNLFMGNVRFYRKVDFSYAHFSNDYYTSFVSINQTKNNEADLNPPYFIFRNIYFPQRAIFNNVDLSRTIFQNSILNGTVFKNCFFPKKGERSVFYPEISQTAEIEIDTELDSLISGKINTLVMPVSENIYDLNISDILILKSTKEEQQEKFFIVSRYDAKNIQELRDRVQRVNFGKSFFGFNEVVCQDCESVQSKNGLIAFRIKIFDEKKHWEVLEDIYRQMKKSLEENRDWQGAGSFYISEMYAKIQLLESIKEQFWYRKMLTFYKIVASFGESIKKILRIMVLTFIFSSALLFVFKPDLGIFGVIERNIGFFLPIFGNNSATIASLNLAAWQNVIIQLEIIWFYLLWFILAIALRRRFRR